MVGRTNISVEYTESIIKVMEMEAILLLQNFGTYLLDHALSTQTATFL
jgi:hypothetical protein